MPSHLNYTLAAAALEALVRGQAMQRRSEHFMRFSQQHQCDRPAQGALERSRPCSTQACRCHVVLADTTRPRVNSTLACKL